MVEESSAAPGKDPRAAMAENVSRMYQYIYGNWFTMITCVYAELDIAQLLKAKPRTTSELAAVTETDPGTLGRFLSCAGALG